MEQEWKDIKEYEGLYQVSNLGNIKSLKKTINGRWGKTKIKEKMLILANDKDGYKVVTLCKNGKQKTVKVHRLVAEMFIPNYNKLPQINHKDENKSNNCVDNLEWCTSKYNINYGTNIKRRIKKTSKVVLQYDLHKNFVAKYKSVHEAQKNTNVYHIYDCCNRKLKTAGGFIWRYENGR